MVPRRASIAGLLALVVGVTVFAHLKFIKHTAEHWVEATEDALDDLDLDERVDFFSHPDTKPHSTKPYSISHSDSAKAAAAAAIAAEGAGAAFSSSSALESGHHKSDSETKHHRADAETQTGQHSSHHMKDAHGKKQKAGAGMMFISQPAGSVLLLHRRSKHNDQKWGLPGGNAEPEDGQDLLATAKREAVEEMGSLPAEYNVTGSILTKRGKHDHKQYTVFVAHVSEDTQRTYTPVLDLEEHSEWRWFSLTEMMQQQGRGTASGSSVLQAVGAGARPAGLQEVPLHPVVELIVNSHKSELLALAGGASARQ